VHRFLFLSIEEAPFILSKMTFPYRSIREELVISSLGEEGYLSELCTPVFRPVGAPPTP